MANALLCAVVRAAVCRNLRSRGTPALLFPLTLQEHASHRACDCAQASGCVATLRRFPPPPCRPCPYPCGATP
jgi:hypothetical protein